MKLSIKIILASLIVFILVIVVLEYIFPTPLCFPVQKYDRPILIAHAAGSIDGHTYTNSKEALLNAKQNGYQFIELDLKETIDGRVVGMHKIDQFNSFVGIEKKNDNLVLHSDSLRNMRLFGSYQVLLDDDINNFFNENKNLYLITDKIEDLDLLESKITIPKNRLLVEVFTYDDYVKALKKGYKYPMLSIYSIEDLVNYIKLIKLRRVKMITLNLELLTEYSEIIKGIHDMGVAIFGFTSNDKDFILKYGDDFLAGFYTDDITYKDLYNKNQSNEIRWTTHK